MPSVALLAARASITSARALAASDVTVRLATLGDAETPAAIAAARTNLSLARSVVQALGRASDRLNLIT